MPIINRNLDGSERKNEESFTLGLVATGATALLRLIPYNCLLQGVNLAAFGISGTPAYSLSVFRSAGGLTSIPLGISLGASDFGTSGPIGATISAPGVTLLAGDALVITSGGANSAIASGIVSVVISALADFKTYQNTVS